MEMKLLMTGIGLVFVSGFLVSQARASEPERLLQPQCPYGSCSQPNPQPQPEPNPQPQPHPGGSLCTGAYTGGFNNGVHGVLFLNGGTASMNVNGMAYAGPLICRDFGTQAAVDYHLGNPSVPGVTHAHGTIVVGHDGRAYLQVAQSNGLGFNGVR